MFLKVFITLLALFCCKSLANDDLEAEWEPCSLNQGTIQSEDVKIFISNANCTKAHPECTLWRDTNATLTIQLKALKSSKHNERGLLSTIPMSRYNIMVPYGKLVNPCETMYANNDNTTNCMRTGMIANTSYSYTSTFPVLRDFPTVKGLTVTVIIRSAPKPRDIRKKAYRLKNFKNYSGDIFVCAILKNVAVSEKPSDS